MVFTQDDNIKTKFTWDEISRYQTKNITESISNKLWVSFYNFTILPSENTDSTFESAKVYYREH